MPPMLEQILQDIETINQMHKRITAAQLTATIRALQAWQTKRLLTSHADLWQQKRFKPAIQFFIDEVYGPKDFSQRDDEIASVAPSITKILPAKGVQSLADALRLNRLSLELDLAIIERLGNSSVNRHSYLQCYQQCDNYTLRSEQIQLVENLGLNLANIVKVTGISTLLMLSKRPAKIAGVQHLHAILNNGFNAFKKIGNVHDFIDPIITRERALMEALFAAPAGAQNPLPECDQRP